MKHHGMGWIAEFIKEVGESSHAQHDSVLATAFRGHSDENWLLVPRLSREAGIKGIGTAKALERWMRFAAPVVPHWPQNPFEWLGLAQHYGVATALLDWTFNPLIALYFACDEGRTTRDGCVWMLDTSHCEQFTHTLMVNPFDERARPAFLPVLGANLRAKSQFGAMTLHPVEDGKPVAMPSKFVTKVSVAAGRKRAIRRALGILGISDRTVYGDLPAAAADFKNRAVIG